jgi:hypothetical protein
MKQHAKEEKIKIFKIVWWLFKSLQEKRISGKIFIDEKSDFGKTE